jgi:hypothetical protein
VPTGRWELKPTLILILLGVGIAAAGCGGSDARVSKLERRVAKLEVENADLREKVDAALRSRRGRVLGLSRRIAQIERRTRANEQALYTGVAAAQYNIACAPSYEPGCHAPLGSPGAVYTEEGKPGRIFATPFP